MRCQTGGDLSAYYTASGSPPGRWYGSGLSALGGNGIVEGATVTEEQMGRLYGRGHDPVTGTPLGQATRDSRQRPTG